MTDLHHKLLELGLSPEEATIYLELVHAPCNALSLSRTSGIARTTVYRIISQLEKRSLISKHTTGEGTYWTASDPSSLEVDIIAAEQLARHQRTILQEMLPHLVAKKTDGLPVFSIRTYEGEEGLKQMCWHELKNKTGVVCFGSGTIEEMIPNRYWAEKHRTMAAAAGYQVREIINAETDVPTFVTNQDYMKLYSCRSIPRSVIAFDTQTVIYDDTVAIYHWRDGHRLGVEILSASYAAMMRSMFEHYWSIAVPSSLKLDLQHA